MAVFTMCKRCKGSFLSAYFLLISRALMKIYVTIQFANGNKENNNHDNTTLACSSTYPC